MADRLLTDRELAAQLEVTRRTTANGNGHPCVRLGPKRIGYPFADVEAWEAAPVFASHAAELAATGTPRLIIARDRKRENRPLKMRNAHGWLGGSAARSRGLMLRKLTTREATVIRKLLEAGCSIQVLTQDRESWLRMRPELMGFIDASVGVVL